MADIQKVIPLGEDLPWGTLASSDSSCGVKLSLASLLQGWVGMGLGTVLDPLAGAPMTSCFHVGPKKYW